MDENQKNQAPGSSNPQQAARPAPAPAGPLRVAMSPTHSHGQTAMKIGERIYSAEPEEVGDLGDEGKEALLDGRLMLVGGTEDERRALLGEQETDPNKAVIERVGGKPPVGAQLAQANAAGIKTAPVPDGEPDAATNQENARNAQPSSSRVPSPTGDRSSSLSGQPVEDSGRRAGASSREKRES